MRIPNLSRLLLALASAQLLVHTCIANPVYTSSTPGRRLSRLLDAPNEATPVAFQSRLRKRTVNAFMSHLGFGWAQVFKEFDSWLPAQTATSTLETFYKGILYNAEHVWPVATPANTLLVKQGALTLRLNCDKQVIPWTMVKDIVKVFLEATELGFTGRYEGKFVYLGAAVTVTTIYVSLKVNHLQTV